MMPKRRQTPEKRRIAAGQALIRRCHSDAEFRRKIVALWRAQLAQDTEPTKKPANKKDRERE